MKITSQTIMIALATALGLRVVSQLHLASISSTDAVDPMLMKQTMELVEERDNLQRDIAQLKALSVSQPQPSLPKLNPKAEPSASTHLRAPPAVPPSASIVQPQQAQLPPPSSSVPAPDHGQQPRHEQPDKLWYYKGEVLPAHYRDFPCALRNFQRAKVTTSCEIDCRDAKCSHASDACERYLECQAIQVDAAPGEDLSRKSAVLKHSSEESRDDSMRLIHSSTWWKSNVGLTNQVKQRTYIVASYGGCGSKMLAGWLSQLPGQHKASVFHFHDRNPPLRAFSKAPPPMINKDYRTGRFRGGGSFPLDSSVVSDVDLDSYRIIYLYKDPVEALVSRYGYGHCKNIRGNCGPTEASWPRLDAYARVKDDKMGLIEYFNHYMHPEVPRKYPILALNYHKLWDNLPAVMEALGLPQSLESTFPRRTETVRNDMTGRAEKNAAHTEATRNGLREMYSPINNEIKENPAVMVV